MIQRWIEGIIIGIISGFIFKGLDKYGGIEIMKSLFQTFVIEMWPVWSGVIIGIIYLFIRFIFDVRKAYLGYGGFVRKTEKGLEKLDQGLREMRFDFKNVNAGFEGRLDKLEKQALKNLQK